MGPLSKYAVVDGSNSVVNIVLWDGVATWSPPASTTAVASGGAAGDAEIGQTYASDTFLAP